MGHVLGHASPLRAQISYRQVWNESHVLHQYLRHLSGVDSVIDPPEFSDLGYYLFNTNGIGHFRKQF